MTHKELIHLIASGEDSGTQFKEDVRNAQSLASEMAAFSNTKGGQILMGVSDLGDAKGLLPYRGLGTGVQRALKECPELQFTHDPEAETFTATIPLSVSKRTENGNVKSQIEPVEAENGTVGLENEPVETRNGTVEEELSPLQVQILNQIILHIPHQQLFHKNLMISVFKIGLIRIGGDFRLRHRLNFKGG